MSVLQYQDIGTLSKFARENIQKDILEVLSGGQFAEVMTPTESELDYVGILFQSRGLANINVITYDLVSSIGRAEFAALNDKLKQFTSKVSSIKAPGLFSLVDTLSREVTDADLPGIWERTTKAKPTLRARFLSLFNPSALNDNLQDQYNNVYKLLTERSKGLESKLSEIESGLVKQKHDQENNIKTLQASFETYFHSFEELRKQFIFIIYLEDHYTKELEKFKQENANSSDLTLNRQLQNYESILSDITNKRLVLHGAILKIPITTMQNNNLINVSKNICKEIDNTLISNFTSIRSNLISLAISLNAQQALLGTNTAKLLDQNAAKLNMQINSQLSVKAELFAGEARLKEAETIRDLISGIGSLNDRINEAKQQSQENIRQATEIHNQSTLELKRLLGNNNYV